MNKFYSVKAKYFLSGAFAFFYFQCISQTVEEHRIDSMLSRLKTLNEDTSKIQLLNNISFNYFTVNPAEGIRRGEEALILAKKLDWKKGLAGAYHSLGANYWARHDLLQAQNYYWECLRLNELMQNRNGISKSLHNLAMIYETQYDYPNALLYYQKALSLYEDLGDTFAQLGCLANIANVYQVQKLYDEALNYFMRSLKLCESYGNERHVGYMLGRIGAIYMFQGKYDLALKYETRSLEILEKFPNKDDIANVLGNIGLTYYDQHNYERALHYLNKALKVSRSNNTNSARGYTAKYLGFIGKIFLDSAVETNRIDDSRKTAIAKQAINYLVAAIKISESVADRENLRDCFLSLSKAQSLLGNYAAALKSYTEYSTNKDSLTNANRNEQMTRHELEYAYEKKKDSMDYLVSIQNMRMNNLINEKKLAKLTLKQQWLYSILVLSILCLLSSYLIFRYRTRQLRVTNELVKEKAEKKLKEAEYQRQLNDMSFSALRSQMNPHFIFNALNTIQGHVYANDKKSASNYLGKFSELIRKILYNSDKQVIPLNEEIELLQLYLDIEKARFGSNLCAVIETDRDIDLEYTFIPPMLIQPYIENAIKHGLLHKEGDKKLIISIRKTPDTHSIQIIIDDNGVGRERSTALNKTRVNHNSFANGANEKRITLINYLYNRDAKVEIVDKKEASGIAAGTKVMIDIPIDLSPPLNFT